jgi:hypothetical protein
VSVGAPDRTALAARNKGLNSLVTHPDDVYVGEPFVFIVQYDGKPLAGQKVEITEAVWTSDRKPHVERLTSDGQGKASFTPKGSAPACLEPIPQHRTGRRARPEYSTHYTLSFHALNPNPVHSTSENHHENGILAGALPRAGFLPGTAQTAQPKPQIGGHGDNVQAFIAEFDADGDGQTDWAEFEYPSRAASMPPTPTTTAP